MEIHRNPIIATWRQVEAGPIDGRIEIQHRLSGWSHIIGKHLSKADEPWHRFADRAKITAICAKLKANAALSELHPLLKSVISRIEPEVRDAFKAPRYIRTRRMVGDVPHQWLVVTDASMAMVLRRSRYSGSSLQLITAFFHFDDKKRLLPRDDVIQKYAKRYCIRLKPCCWVAPEPDEEVGVDEGQDDGSAKNIFHQDVCFVSLENWGIRNIDGSYVFTPWLRTFGTRLFAEAPEQIRRLLD